MSRYPFIEDPRQKASEHIAEAIASVRYWATIAAMHRSFLPRSHRQQRPPVVDYVLAASGDEP